MKIFDFGRSESGICIEGTRYGQDFSYKLLILGGIHGDETEGVALALELQNEFRKNFPYKIQIDLIPMVNIDGVLAKTRHNANGVDLNRNLPTKDWSKDAFTPRYYPGERSNSEAENIALTKYIDEEKPNFIISLHSFRKTLLNVNGNCLKEAEVIANFTGLPIEPSMGYPTPGCLGTYTGLEKNIPTITYELLRNQDLSTLLPTHLRAIKECIKYMEQNN